MEQMISPIYAGFLALLLLALSARVIQHRRNARISIGGAGDKLLQRKMRVQANCAEYAPLGIILLVLTELQGAPDWAIHSLGAMLLIGRMSHAVGMGASPQRIKLRDVGMVLTLTMIACTALGNIAHSLF